MSSADRPLPSSESKPGMGPWRSGEVAGFTPYPSAAMELSVGDRFRVVAEEFAGRPAVRSPGGSWTYGELLDDCSRVAAALVATLGDGPEPVAILTAHDGVQVVAIMSVVLAGHIVVVIDPSAPPQATDHVLAESGARVVLSDQVHSELASELAGRHGVQVLGIEDVLGEDTGATGRPLPVVDPGRPMMLAFTSGTSGAPKAAIISHAVINSVVRGATDALGVTASDCMPMLFPTSLAVAAYPLFIPLLNGGTLATFDVRGLGLQPLPDFLIDERITLAYMAPTVVRFLADAASGKRFPDLRLVALGGELVDGQVVELTRDILGPEHIANGFGTTETGVIALYVLEPDARPTGIVPCGYAVPDIDVEVVDHFGRTAVPGEYGEVVAISSRLFDGYWGHPELTNQVLQVADDSPSNPGRRYRTGDIGYLDADGALVVSGRIDTKVKVRGRFVVLGDVEADVRELDEVADAAVLAVEGRTQTDVAAVVSLVDGARVSTVDLRSRMLQHAEPFRVPSRWVVVDELPRLPNGKVDRRRLADLVDEPLGSTRSRTAPEPAAVAARERVVRDLWEELLPVPVVGLDDDFFELGGDSLLAAQMLVALEGTTGVTIPMSQMLHGPTVRSVAAALESGSGPSSAAVCVQRGDTDRPRLWFVPDLQGSAFRVRHLARSLGVDQPLWSFESPLLDGRPNVYPDLEAFAAHYVRCAVDAQPHGPYWLAGYSFGGICAYEMARQLRVSGADVEFLAIVDVGPGYRGPNWREGRVPFRPWFGIERPPAPGASAVEVLDHYRAMWRRSKKRAARHAMVRSGAYRAIDPLRFRIDLARRGRVRAEWRLWYAWEEHWKLAVRAWDRTRTYPGRVDLFWASQTGSTDSTMGWGSIVDDLHIHRFPGFHDHLLEASGAPALGEVLRETIDARRSP